MGCMSASRRSIRGSTPAASIPGLWRPTPGIQTLAFEPYRVDLTPYAAWLSSGQPHSVARARVQCRRRISRRRRISCFYLDHGADTVDGEVITNTLFGAEPVVDTNVTTDASGAISGDVTVTSSRDFEISGYVDTSDGRITTTVAQHIDFSNAQTFAISDSTYHQALDMQTHVDTTTTVDNGAYKHVATEQPQLAARDRLSLRHDRGRLRADDVGRPGPRAHDRIRHRRLQLARCESRAAHDDRRYAAVRRGLQRDRRARIRASQQSYSYLDPFGACYDRTITTAAGALTAVADGAACPGGVNDLPSFDSFHNAGSLVFGATLQILP